MGSEQGTVDSEQGSGFRVQHSPLVTLSSSVKQYLSLLNPISSFCNLQSFLCGWLVAAIIACFAATARGEVDLPEPNRSDPIAVSADAANRWTSGSYDVWLLKGNCRIQQGVADARCSEALLWIERADGDGRPQSKIIAYLEGDVELARNGPTAPAKVKDRKSVV